MTATAEFLEFVWVWNAAQGRGQETPAVHRRIARWLQARRAAGDRRLLLMAFRGCGKSTLVGLYCAWRLLLDPDARILVLAADHDLAVKMVATVGACWSATRSAAACSPTRRKAGPWTASP